MNTLVKLLPALAVAGLLGACDRGAADREATIAANAETEAAAASAPAIPPAGPPEDAVTPVAGESVAASEAERGALGVLNAINEHEIATAEQALARTLPDDVAAYARRMIDEHSRNRDQTARFNPDAAAPAAIAQRDKAAAAREQLGASADAGYTRAYVEAMVRDHTEALAALDNDLIPAAESDAVREHLTTTRGHVAAHLEQAQALLGGLPAR
ncbi:DUF4142 domain-containing protein [Pseudoxanthomonas mexicana]|uniref:DUF4142 domain-containing protein n=1 Tax=Pseudoxanthomonas mexicana TaxID=128785 RepID=UPI00398B7928